MKSLTHFHFSKHGAFARRFAFAPLAAIFTALAPTAVVFAADGPIAAVQEALVKQQLLAGEPSGVLDESTRAALRTFQTRHDLPATGEIDTATLEALQKPTETSSSATESRRKENVVAVLAQTTAESDREFLREVESGRAETGASENSTTTEAPAKTVSPSEQPRVVLPHGENPRRELPEIAMSPERELSSAEDADAVDSHGTRIVRSTTTFAPRNHHSSTTEKKTMMHTEAGAIEVRRAEPVDPQPKPITLLHRFFGGQ